MHPVLADGRSASWSGGRWTVTEFAGRPLVLILRHGLTCDGPAGATPCVQAVGPDRDGFRTVRLPESDEDSAVSGAE